MPLGMPVLAIDERTALQHGVLTDDYIMAAALYYDQLLTAPAAVDTSDSESGNADATDSDSDSDASDAAARRRADLHDAACEPLVAAALAAELVKLRDMPRTTMHGVPRRCTPEDWETHECWQQMRFLPEGLHALYDALNLAAEGPLVFAGKKKNCSWTPMEALMFTCYRLAWPRRLTDCAKAFGRHQSTISRATTWFSRWYMRKHHKRLFRNLGRWKESVPEWVNAVRAKGLPLDAPVWVDGVIDPVARPWLYQRPVYNGHKKVHCLNYLAATMCNGLIGYVWGPELGRHHDAFLLHTSDLFEQLDELFADEPLTTVAFGDSAFPKIGRLQSAFKGSKGAKLRGKRRKFNKRMSSLGRICVEWGFGCVKNVWKGLTMKCMRQVWKQQQGNTFCVALFLTNCRTCLNRGNVITSYMGTEAPTLDEYINGA